MELTDLEIALTICIYLFGVFSCRFATQFFEVCHAARLVSQVVHRLLLMCAKINEDVAFIREIKYQHLKEGDFTSKQIRDFRKVDDAIVANWKNSVIQNILVSAPVSFSFVVNFTSWKEAMRRLDEMTNETRGD